VEAFWREAWGLDNALAAKCVPTQSGFKLVTKKEHDEFEKTLVGKTWEPDLGQQSWQ
jgi:hypothetical protein